MGVGLPVDQGDLLCVLLFADDILLLANSAQELDQLLGVVQDYCRRWRLELSQTKTKKLVFGRYDDDGGVDDVAAGAGVSETDVYKYLGLLFQREMSWEKAKARMFRNAQKASIWSWNLLMRTGNPSVKGLTGIYTGLVRPYLEYGAEVWGDFAWEEAEVLQRMIGRRILRLNKTVANEVVMGELGWLPLKARRMMLRLFFWLKILGMKDSRWVKRVYLEAKRRLDTHPDRVNWASHTRDVLVKLGLGDYWESQGPPSETEWRLLVREKVHEYEQREWRIRMSTKPKLDTYRRWKLDLVYEPYLNTRDPSSRRAMSELRSGANRLRVETGRHEYMKLIPRKSNGFAKRRKLKREERTCELCYAGVEDEMHFMWDCEAYDRRRDGLLSDLEADVEPWVLVALRMNNRSRMMTKIELADRYRALRHITQDKTVRLVTRYIRDCNRIRRSLIK